MDIFKLLSLMKGSGAKTPEKKVKPKSGLFGDPMQFVKEGMRKSFQNSDIGGLLDDPMNFARQQFHNSDIGRLADSPKKFLEYDLLGGVTKTPAEFQRYRMKEYLLEQGMTSDQADQILDSMPQT